MSDENEGTLLCVDKVMMHPRWHRKDIHNATERRGTDVRWWTTFAGGRSRGEKIG